MHKRISKAILAYLIDFLNIQLFITLISLPIFISWGISISVISLFSNIICSPFLTLHILLSSLIFLCALFGAPCIPALWLLEHISNLWLFVLHYIPETTQYGFAQISWINKCIIILVSLTILHTKRYTKHKKILLYTCLLASIIAYAEYKKRSLNTIIPIECFNGQVQLIATHNHCIIIDPGFIGQRLSSPAWAEHTLLSTITKETGHTTIDALIILRPTLFTFKALELLCKKRAVHTIYIPHCKEHNNTALTSATAQFLTIASNYKCIVTFFDVDQKITIFPNIVLSTANRVYKKNNTLFPYATICCMIDNKSFTFYASHNDGQKSKKSP